MVHVHGWMHCIERWRYCISIALGSGLSTRSDFCTLHGCPAYSSTSTFLYSRSVLNVNLTPLVTSAPECSRSRCWNISTLPTLGLTSSWRDMSQESAQVESRVSIGLTRALGRCYQRGIDLSPRSMLSDSKNITDGKKMGTWTYGMLSRLHQSCHHVRR